jgi:hypothetical protein
MPPTETETATIEPAVDVDGTATPPPVPTDPSTGPPDPVPSPRPAPIPAGPVAIAIPDGEPGPAALALLDAIKPDAPRVLSARIDRIAGELADQVEAFRIDTQGTFPDFIRLAGRRVKLRRALEARAGRPSPGSAASEVLGLIRSVKRFRPAEELKLERSRRIASARGELAEVERKVQAEVSIARTAPDGSIGHPDPKAEQEGFGHHHDAILCRLRPLLERRQSIRDRLAKLDARGDAGRSAAARSAIEAAGGVDAVVAALTPSMTAAAEGALQALRADIDATARKLSRIDDESRLAGDLRASLEAMEGRVPGLQWTIGEQRKAAAGELVQDAVTGDLAAVKRLAVAVGPKLPALAEALDAVRATDDDLVSVVEELIG